MKVQIVIPVYNEEANVARFVRSLVEALPPSQFDASILLVDDGSSDRSLDEILTLKHALSDRLSYLSMSRNFGKEAALLAGITECGDDFDLLAYMDGDGQHTAHDLLRLLECARASSADLICGVRTIRTYQSNSQRFLAKAFYYIFHKLTGQHIEDGAGDFNVLRPKVVRALRQLSEPSPFMKGLIAWVGFKRETVPITIAVRNGGVSKASTRRMLRLALGAVLSFSSWPLRAWSIVGMTSALLALLYLVVVIVNTTVYGREVPGYATTVVLLLGLGGLQLLSIGIVGEYVARIYDAAKRRPRYLIASRG